MKQLFSGITMSSVQQKITKHTKKQKNVTYN